MTLLIRPQGVCLVAVELRARAMMWTVAGILPLPILVATDPASSGDIACLYLGLASAWLVVEFHRGGGTPDSPAGWGAKVLAQSIAVAGNVVLFIAFGLAAGVQTHFPFPLMAALSAFPSLGLLPFFLRRLRNPYAAIVLCAVLVLACKLAGCVVARFTYGPDFLERGYVSADWRTAKLMISLFWSFTMLLSAGLLVADYAHYRK